MNLREGHHDLTDFTDFMDYLKRIILRHRHKLLANPSRNTGSNLRSLVRNKLFIHIRLVEIINPDR